MCLLPDEYVDLTDGLPQVQIFTSEFHNAGTKGGKAEFTENE